MDQAADEIDVHRATVYRMIDDGRLAAQKQGKGWRIRAGEVDRFLAGVAAEPPESAVAEVHARHARLARLARLLAWLAGHPRIPFEYVEVAAAGDTEIGLAARGVAALTTAATAAAALRDATITAYFHRGGGPGGHVRLTVTGATSGDPNAVMIMATVAIDGPAKDALLQRAPRLQATDHAVVLDPATLTAAARGAAPTDQRRGP